MLEVAEQHVYSVEVVGHADTASRSDIALDGESTVEVELAIPLAPGAEADAAPVIGRSIISSAAPDAAGKQARLIGAVGNEFKQTVDMKTHSASPPAWTRASTP